MRKKSSIISHLIDHEKIDLDKHIEEIVLQNQSSGGGGGGGGKTLLADMLDVNITNVGDGDIIKYSESESKWVNSHFAIPALSSAPSDAIVGELYLNTTDHKIYIYYSGQWQVLHTLSSVTPEPATGNPMGLWLPFYRTYTI